MQMGAGQLAPLEKGDTMAEIKDVMAWADAICSQALVESRNGNTNLANKIGSNSAFQMYFNNVHGLRNVVNTSFPKFYPNQWQEIEQLYLNYQQQQQTVEAVNKIDTLDARFDKLEKMVEQLIEAQNPAASVKPPKKGKKVDPEPTPEDETEEGEDAESEA